MRAVSDPSVSLSARASLVKDAIPDESIVTSPVKGDVPLKSSVSTSPLMV